MSDGIHGIKILKGKVHIMKTIEEFYIEAMADKALEEAVSKAHKENRLAEFLNEHGVDGTAEAFEAIVKEKKLESLMAWKLAWKLQLRKVK